MLVHVQWILVLHKHISTYIRILMIWYLNCKNIIMLHSFYILLLYMLLIRVGYKIFSDEKRYWIVLLSVIYEWSWLYWILPLSDFVSDFEFSPFDDYLLATGSADNSVSLGEKNPSFHWKGIIYLSERRLSWFYFLTLYL